MILILAGFLLALAGTFWLLEDDQARVAIARMLPDQLVVSAEVNTDVPDKAQIPQANVRKAAPNSQANPAQLAQATEQPSRREPSLNRSAASRRQASEDSKSLWSKRTLAFWTSLNRIMTKEVAMRKGNKESNLRSTEFAVRAIRGLDRRYVDVRVQALAEEIVDWYSEQFQHGTNRAMVLTAATHGGVPQRHVRRDVDLDRRSEKLRGKMSDKYDRPFPSLQ